MHINYALTTLNLRKNNFGYEGAKKIAEMLGNGSNVLQNLNISENFIQDEGGQLIAIAIATASRLKTIDMRDTDIRDETAKELAQTLKRNKSVKCLNIESNMVSLNYYELIQQTM